MKPKKRNFHLITGLVLFSLAASPLVLAKSMAEPPAPQATQQQAKGPTGKGAKSTAKRVQKQMTKRAGEKRSQIVSEAVEAVKQTVNALQLLDKGKTQEAIKALEIATGKLELVIARDPHLALVPVDVQMSTFDLYADPKTIEEVKKKALEALKDNRVQEARTLISTLASEVVIHTTMLPLATYPDAMKEATRLIDKGKVDEAKVVLQAALNTLLIEDEVIPLPPLRASLLIDEAEKLAEKRDRSKEENKKLKELLDAAQWQVKIAEALGYGDKEVFKPIYDELDKIREKTAGQKSGKGFFDTLREKMKKLTGRHGVKHHP